MLNGALAYRDGAVSRERAARALQFRARA
jgi:hypothetical protein